MSKGKLEQRLEEYTQSVIEQLESVSKGSWIPPWKGGFGHRNAVTGHQYSGSNIMRLWLHSYIYGFDEKQWLTFNQARQLGGTIKKGSIGCPISIYFVMEDDDGNVKPAYKTAYVFNIKSVEDIDLSKSEAVASAEAPVFEEPHLEVIKSLDGIAEVVYGETTPHYRPREDKIYMLSAIHWNQYEEYVSTLVHEHIHWTGHESRLARLTNCSKQSEEYAFEELVAELGASFYVSEYGVDIEKLQHKEYLKSWISMMKEDSSILFKAATAAEKAIKYLKKEQNVSETEERRALPCAV